MNVKIRYYPKKQTIDSCDSSELIPLPRDDCYPRYVGEMVAAFRNTYKEYVQTIKAVNKLRIILNVPWRFSCSKQGRCANGSAQDHVSNVSSIL